VLKGNGPEHPSLHFSRKPLFGFHGSLEAVRPMSLVYDASGVFIDYLDSISADDVIHIKPEERLGMKRAINRKCMGRMTAYAIRVICGCLSSQQ
jgi:hypothetical protein